MTTIETATLVATKCQEDDISLYVSSEPAHDRDHVRQFDSIRFRGATLSPAEIDELYPPYEITDEVLADVRAKSIREAQMHALIADRQLDKAAGYVETTDDRRLRTIVDAYRPLAIHIALTNQPSIGMYEASDIASVGTETLLECLDTFVIGASSFKSYLGNIIPKRLVDHFRIESPSMIRLPRSHYPLYREVANEMSNGKANENEATLQAACKLVAERRGVAVANVERAYQDMILLGGDSLSLETVFDTGSEHSYEDYIGSAAGEYRVASAEDSFLTGHVTDLIREALDVAAIHFNDKERAVLYDHLLGGKKLKELGKQFGVGESRMGQIAADVRKVLAQDPLLIELNQY